MRRSLAATQTIVLSLGLAIGWASAAETPTVDFALGNFRPVQKDVEYETPPTNQYAQCQVKVERSAGSSGWVVLGPAGQILRRFVDTSGDNVVDQWRYYNHGIEVYRDLDTNGNNRIDQFRWLNTGGTRWAVDSDEDGRIDRWKRLSAEEATRVAVAALVENDERMLRTLLITEEDLKQLRVGAPLAGQVLKAVGSGDRKLSDILGQSRAITPQTKWMRFDSVLPSVIPADEGKAEVDLLVHENAMAIVDTSGQTGLIQFGEMVCVGDVWKLTQLPQPLEGNTVQVTVGGVLMRPSGDTTAPAATGAMAPEMQRLLEQLQTLDKDAPAPNAGRTALVNHATQRTNLLSQLVGAAKSAEDKQQWLRQLVDHLASGAQSGVLADAIPGLKSIESQLASASPSSPLVPYAIYRRLMAEYAIGMQTADTAQQQKIQEQWLASLRQFVQTYPTAEDAADATLQLAVHYEFGGNAKEARGFYTQVVEKYSKTPAGARAAGALRRLDLAGKPLTLSGPGLSGGTVDIAQYKGRVVLVFCWATWCTPCTEDLPQLRALYAQYRERGFEIVGVNLDTTSEPVAPFLSQNRVTWPQIFQPGGLNSAIAQEFGIVSLPTLFLVDQQGTVITSNTSVDDLKTRLAELFKK